jgi:uncharacterized membrane protein
MSGYGPPTEGFERRSTADSAVLTHRGVLRGALAVQAVVLVIAGLEWAGLSVSLLREVVVTGYLTFVPGALLLVALGIDRRRPATMAGYAVGLSLLTIMVVGTVMSLVYPMFGVVRPLSEGPLLVTFLVLVVGLAAVIHRGEVRFETVVPTRSVFDVVPLSLLLLPFVSFLGTAVYVLAETNVALIAMLLLVAVAPVVVGLSGRTSRWLALAVWTISLALVYFGRFGSGGGHQTSVLTVRNGRWLIETGSVLPNAVLYPVYAILNDVSIGLQWGGINPFIVSFIPLILFEAFRRYLSDRRSFIGTCLFMFSFPYYTLYPGGGRVATPVLFLALLGLVLSDTDLEIVQKVVLSVLFGAGVGVSHYGTAYLVVFGLIASAVFVRLLMAYDYLRFGGEGSLASRLRADGGVASARIRSLLRAPFVVFMSTFVVAWYLLTDDAEKFSPLPTKVQAQIDGILYGEFTGSAAEAATKSYGGSQSVAISRNLYMLVGALMVLGIAVTFLLRLRRRETAFDDEYLALGVGFLGLLGASFLPGGDGFNVARVMMIAFAFTVPFAVVGAERPLELLGRAFGGETGRRRLRRVGTVSFSVLLCVFLLFNAGVMSELVFEDFGPSQTISEQRLAESEDPQLRLRVTPCPDCNVDTHVWVRSHAAPAGTIYGDDRAVAHIDFYRGDLTDRLGYVPSKAVYASMLGLADGTEGPAYVMLLTHNTDTGVLIEGSRYEIHDLSTIEPALKGSNRVYQGGGTEIHHTG